MHIVPTTLSVVGLLSVQPCEQKPEHVGSRVPRTPLSPEMRVVIVGLPLVVLVLFLCLVCMFVCLVVSLSPFFVAYLLLYVCVYPASFKQPFASCLS